MYAAATSRSFTSNQPSTRDLQTGQAIHESNANRAYVALQSNKANPMRERLPGVVNTKRKKLSRNQIAERYLKSIEGNRDIDINKPPRVVSKERIEARLPAVLRNAWPKASLHRNVEMPCYNGGSQLKRNVAEGNAALGLYTSWQPVKNDYFEYIWAMDEYRLWAIENNFLDPYSRRGEGELHHPVVDFIGPSPVCGVDHLLLIELSLFDQLKTY